MFPYQIIHAKEFTGKLCRFGEPAFGFSRVEGKGTAKWRRMLFIGKTEPSWLLHIGVGSANLDMAVGCFLRSLQRQRWAQVTLDQLAWSSQVRARTRTQRQFARNTWKRLNQWSFAIHDKVLPRNMFQLTRSKLHCNLVCWWWANQKIMIYVWIN